MIYKNKTYTIIYCRKIIYYIKAGYGTITTKEDGNMSIGFLLLLIAFGFELVSVSLLIPSS